MKHFLQRACLLLVLIPLSHAHDANGTQQNIAHLSTKDYFAHVDAIPHDTLRQQIYQDTAKDLIAQKETSHHEVLEKKQPAPQTFTANVSAYTAAADECGKSDGITASGRMVKEHHTLACPRSYKLGTKIHIEGMGTYTCDDRGGAIKGNHFDIYMKTKSQAFAFGRRNLTAYVVS